jgi:hypothetical protein
MAKISGVYANAKLQRPFDSFRFLRLTRTLGGEISCTFQVHLLPRCPPFIALSYAWGPPSPTHPIEVEGQNFDIRENLYLALHSIMGQQDEFLPKKSSTISILSWRSRKSTTPNIFRYFYSAESASTLPLFWIDQICINQDDVIERSEQVRRMGELFSKASMVLSWLGPAGDASDTAIAHICKGSLMPPIHAQVAVRSLCNRSY